MRVNVRVYWAVEESAVDLCGRKVKGQGQLYGGGASLAEIRRKNASFPDGQAEGNEFSQILWHRG